MATRKLHTTVCALRTYTSEDEEGPETSPLDSVPVDEFPIPLLSLEDQQRCTLSANPRSPYFQKRIKPNDYRDTMETKDTSKRTRL